MRKKITEIINEWDPIELLSFAPDDEYEPEVDEIVKTLQFIKDEEDLALEIQRIFIKFFNIAIFEKDYNECLVIARKILK